MPGSKIWWLECGLDFNPRYPLCHVLVCNTPSERHLTTLAVKNNEIGFIWWSGRLSTIPNVIFLPHKEGKLEDVLFIPAKRSVLNQQTFITSQCLRPRIPGPADWVLWFRAPQKAIVGVLAEATFISRLSPGRLSFHAYAPGCWQNLVPCLLSHWGPHFLSGCCLEVTLSALSCRLLRKAPGNMVAIFCRRNIWEEPGKEMWARCKAQSF